jgi:N-acetylmuramoyl-L-alanine amidase
MKKKNMKKWAVVSAAIAFLFVGKGTASAATNHQVQKGDYHISIDDIKKANDRRNDIIYIGESLFIPTNDDDLYKIKKGDTLSSIAKNYGVSIEELQQANNLTGNLIYAQAMLTIPNKETAQPAQRKEVKAAETNVATQPSTAEQASASPENQGQAVSPEERDLLERVVEAEAKGESYEGKVAVANVVLNRVASSEFPDTITEVINQKIPGGSYAFTPVQNGSINNPASEESKKAVNEAITNRAQKETLFFYNPDIATSEWIKSRPVVARIGEHVFMK